MRGEIFPGCPSGRVGRMPRGVRGVIVRRAVIDGTLTRADFDHFCDAEKVIFVSDNGWFIAPARQLWMVVIHSRGRSVVTEGGQEMENGEKVRRCRAGWSGFVVFSRFAGGCA